jgi:type VI protein secretion system component Hcp
VDGAEVYLLMIRASGLPILGEAKAPPFEEQVEIAKWDWKLANQNEVERRKKEDADTDFAAKSDKELELQLEVEAEDFRTGANDDSKKLLQIATDARKSVRERMRLIEEMQQQGAEKSADLVNGKVSAAKAKMKDYQKAKEKEAAGNLEFKFSKRMDFASTQMLNCMKAGEILPRVLITLFHRSVSAPLSVVVEAKNLRFVKYELSVEVDDTMADMKEDWEAEFSDLSFSYNNTRHIAEARAHASAAQGAAKATAPAKMALAAKQTTNRFVMKSRT